MEEEALLRALGLTASPEQCTVAAVVPQHSLAWHRLRTLRLTASEVAAAVGQSRYLTPAQLVQQKLALLGNVLMGRDPSEGLFTPQQRSNTVYGTASEPMAAIAYFSQAPVGTVMMESGFYIHHFHPWIGASPDRLLQFPDGVVG